MGRVHDSAIVRRLVDGIRKIFTPIDLLRKQFRSLSIRLLYNTGRARSLAPSWLHWTLAPPAFTPRRSLRIFHAVQKNPNHLCSKRETTDDISTRQRRNPRHSAAPLVLVRAPCSPRQDTMTHPATDFLPSKHMAGHPSSWHTLLTPPSASRALWIRIHHLPASIYNRRSFAPSIWAKASTWHRSEPCATPKKSAQPYSRKSKAFISASKLIRKKYNHALHFLNHLAHSGRAGTNDCAPAPRVHVTDEPLALTR